ncbi:MAG: hypothetical protein A2218_07825 [Elusimicrobia bacterium RIFOXYA2_FULL_53_38]|nr:MAG: hypothetical protein A2218_07825 [Elusimicrobia bacterium RIFOXYA2_FULL_53_38]
MLYRALTAIKLVLFTTLSVGVALEAQTETQTIGWIIILLAASAGYGAFNDQIKEYLKSKNDFHLINTGCLFLIGIGLLFKFSHSIIGSPPLFYALDKYLNNLVTALLINWIILIILVAMIGREPDDKAFAKRVGKELILKDSSFEKELFIKELQTKVIEEREEARKTDKRISEMVKEFEKQKSGIKKSAPTQTLWEKLIERETAPVTRSAARELVTKYLVEHPVKDVDGVAKVLAHGEPGSREPAFYHPEPIDLDKCWIVYLKRAQTPNSLHFGGSHIIIISRETGKVFYSGPDGA